MRLSLQFDPERMRRYATTGRNLPFGIAWEHEGTWFPDDQWDDFGLVLLDWWCGALLRLVAGARVERLQFMEGPYAVLIAIDQFDEPARLTFEGSAAEWHVPLVEIAAAISAAAATVQQALDSMSLSSFGTDGGESIVSLVRRTEEAVRHRSGKPPGKMGRSD